MKCNWLHLSIGIIDFNNHFFYAVFAHFPESLFEAGNLLPHTHLPIAHHTCFRVLTVFGSNICVIKHIV